MNYKILFPVEITTRELMYKLALSIKFSELGHKCYIGHKGELQNLFSRVSPFIYFDKGYHQNKSKDIYEDVINNNGIVVSLDEEGGVDSEDLFTLNSRYSEEVFDYCELIFLWGETQYDFLKQKRTNFNPKKTVISGGPRFHLYKKDFLDLYIDEVNKLKNKYNKYILINTNMGFGNNIRGDDFVYWNYKGRLKNIKKFIEYDKRKLNDYFNMIKKLSEAVDFNIVIRPHPEENKDVYIREFKNVSNIFVEYSGNIAPWIIGAEVMIHPDCTTGIEALMLGKRAISFLKNYDDDISMHLPCKLSHRFSDTEELIAFIKEQKYLLQESKKEDQLLEKYFAFKKDSLDIIVKDVTDLLKDKKSEIPGRDVKYSFIFKKRALKFVYKILGFIIKKSSSMLVKNKQKGLEKREVITFFNKIKKVISLNSDIEISQVYSSLFEVKKQKY